METAKLRSPTDSQTVPAMVLTKRLRDRLGESLRKVVLFGSRARGDARADSDWDVLVLLDEVSPARRRLVEDTTFDVSMQTEAIFAVAIAAHAQFEADRYEPLFVNVRREGIEML